MSDDEELEQDEPEEPKKVLPWLSGPEVFKKYGKPLSWIKMMAAAKRLKTRMVNGGLAYSTEDLEKLINEDDTEGPNDPQQAFVDTIKTLQTHAARAEADTREAFKILREGTKELMESLEKSHASLVVAYQAQCEENRKLQSEARNDRIEQFAKEEIARGEAVRQRQMDQIIKQISPLSMIIAAKYFPEQAPLLMKYMNGQAVPKQEDGASAPQPTPEQQSQLAAVGQAVIEELSKMTDENFVMLQKAVAPDMAQVLTMLRSTVKGNQS
jgi:hypothetical protein